MNGIARSAKSAWSAITGDLTPGPCGSTLDFDPGGPMGRGSRSAGDHAQDLVATRPRAGGDVEVAARTLHRGAESDPVGQPRGRRADGAVAADEEDLQVHVLQDPDGE